MDYVKYNGWTNRATWLVNLHFGDYFQAQIDDGERLWDADDIETFLYDYFDERSADKNDLFYNDVTGSFIADVDFDELVDNLANNR